MRTQTRRSLFVLAATLIITTLGGCTNKPMPPAPQGASEEQFNLLYSEIFALRDQLGRQAAAGSEARNGVVMLEPVGGPGGYPFRAVCPEGWFITGFHGRAGSMLDSIGPICSPIEQIVSPPSGAMADQLWLTRAGGREGDPYIRTCPAGTAVVGIQGGYGQLLDSVTGVCGPIGGAEETTEEPEVAEGTGQAPTVTRRVREARRTRLEHIGGSGGDQYDRSCPEGYIGAGLSGAGGFMVDRLALHCAPQP
ncbi:MAG: hypothetical protein KC561_01645 [Myxococcales bacterium]|nr:hypothetical protein [Myxococcales bacterium]